MKTKKMFRAVVTLSMMIMAVLGANAEAATVAYEDVDFIRGVGYRSDSFTVETAGSYRVTLTDFSIPSAFEELNLTISTNKNVIDRVDGFGQFDFEAEIGTTYFANLYGDAGGSLDLGLYGISVEAVGGTVAPVPVPASLFMLASALAVLGAFGRGGSRAAQTSELEFGQPMPA